MHTGETKLNVTSQEERNIQNGTQRGAHKLAQLLKWAPTGMLRGENQVACEQLDARGVPMTGKRVRITRAAAEMGRMQGKFGTVLQVIKDEFWLEKSHRHMSQKPFASRVACEKEGAEKYGITCNPTRFFAKFALVEMEEGGAKEWVELFTDKIEWNWLRARVVH